MVLKPRYYRYFRWLFPHTLPGKVGEALTVKTTPENATNVATYAWSTSDAADGNFTKVEGATAASLTIDSSFVGKYVKVVITDADGKEFSAVTTAAVAAKEGTLEAKQTGANTIVTTAGDALAASDKVEVKKGSTVQDIKYVLGEDGKTVTITSTSKITGDDYTVTVTPADQGKAPMTASFKGEAEKKVPMERQSASNSGSPGCSAFRGCRYSVVRVLH